MRATEEIRKEHVHLLAGIEALREAGDLVGKVSADTSVKEADRVLEFLHQQLLPHAAGEEEGLYPVVGRLMGSPSATRTMSVDHEEIGALVRDLQQATEERDLVAMRRLLYGLYHLIRAHFAKEEEVYLPLLDERLGPEEAGELVRAAHAH